MVPEESESHALARVDQRSDLCDTPMHGTWKVVRGVSVRALRIAAEAGRGGAASADASKLGMVGIGAALAARW